MSEIRDFKYNKKYTIITPKNYSKRSKCYQLVWKDIFMPFDVIKGLDECPPDDEDSGNYDKTYWWVCAAEKYDGYSYNSIRSFITLPDAKSFKTLSEALDFCFKWRKNWLLKELEK